MFSMKVDNQVRTVAPPNQMAKELIQQQLVPIKNATTLPQKVFLWLSFMFYFLALKEILVTLEAMSFASSLFKLKFISFAIFFT